MHPAVAAPLLYGNAPPAGVVSLPNGAQPAQPPPQTNSSPTYKGDTISYSPSRPSATSTVKMVEVTDAERIKAERIKKALRDVVIFAAAVSGTMFIIVPIILELRETRGKAQAHLLQEDFKLSLRNALRGADDPALKWVRRWEAMNVDPEIVERIASHMHEAWDEFKEVQDTKVSREDDKYKDALRKVEEWEIPINKEAINKSGATNNDAGIKLSRQSLPPSDSVNPSAGALITEVYHDTLHDLQKATIHGPFLDGDTFRLMEFNAKRYFASTRKGNNYRPIIESLRLYPTRSNARAEEYRTKLVTLHQAALRRFLETAR